MKTLLAAALMGTGGLLAAGTAVDAEARCHVAVLKDAAVGVDATIAEAVADALRREKFEVAFLTAEAVCDADVLSPQRHFLYVIPGATAYPAAGANALARHLGGGGSLMVLGTPPFGKPVWKHEGRWADDAFVRDAMKDVRPARMLRDFDGEAAGQAADWAQSGAYRKHTAAEIVPGGAAGSPGCLKITLDYESGSPTGMGAPIAHQAGPSGGGLLCFWVKGDGQTARLAVRLIEETEPLQRGIAVIAINGDWTHHVLRAEDFCARGHADPFKARRLSFELVDRDITPHVADGKHTVWVDQIGTAPHPFPGVGDVGRNPFPLIETLSPAYKMYPLTNIATLTGTGNGAMTLPAGATALSCYARPEGKGFERGYKWRWIPLVRALDKDGVERGTAAWMLLHQAPLSEGPAFADAVRRLVGAGAASVPVAAEGSVCAVCTIADPAVLKGMARTGFIGGMARRISDGVFLSHAGSREFSVWPGEKVPLGAVAVNHGARHADIAVRMRVSDTGGRDAVFQRESELSIKPGGSATAKFEWAPQELSGRTCVVTTELIRDGRVIDTIAHEMGVLGQEKASRDAFVTVRDGDFWLEGRKWYPVGVNYWPRYAIALEQEDYTFHWLSPGFYNPEEVERDLRQLESMGANFVAIRAHHRNDRRTVLDFLRRCGNHGIRVFIFVASHVITDDPHYFQGLMMPHHFQEKDVAEFIRATGLADNPTLMGWDLIWEPAGWLFGGRYNSFGWTETAPYRQRWDADWARWIDERYGSLADAEADWGVPAPRLDGRVTSPTDLQFRDDGPSRVMVAAYRRFMDNLMSRKWNDATRALRRLDPNHLVSFRQGNLPPWDFTLTATPKHVDFFAMEGYGFKPDAKGVGAAGFINRYIHFATKGKPYLWVEFGASAWDREAMRPGEKEIAYQAQCHELIHRLAFETGANGAAPWWLAGGYRISEKSDFGILDPDGALRPSGALLRQYAAKFKTPRGYPKPDAWFTMDRDAHNGAHWHAAFNEGAEAFADASAQGRQLGIRTPGTGTTSADTPLVAVGNTKYNGRNPPKYLDAEFNWFRIRPGGGEWIEVADGARVRVPRGVPLAAAASVGNLQDATWLAPASCAGKPGAVFLASTGASGIAVKQPVSRDTARLDDAEFGPGFSLGGGIAEETRVELQMTAEGRAWFGERLRFTLEPEAVAESGAMKWDVAAETGRVAIRRPAGAFEWLAEQPAQVTYWDADGKERSLAVSPADGWRIERGPAEQGCRLLCRHDALGFSIALDFSAAGDALTAGARAGGIAEDGAARLKTLRLLPRFGAAIEGDEGHLVIAQQSGALCRFRDKKPGEHWVSVYQSSCQCPMPLFGIVRGKSAVAGIITGGQFDARFCVSTCFGKDRQYAIDPAFTLRSFPEEARLPDDIAVEYHILPEDQSDWLGIGKCYRQHNFTRRGIRPLRARAAASPALAYSAGALEVRVRLGVKPVPPVVKEQTPETEPPIREFCNFARVRELLDEFHRQGIARLECCLVGWNRGGHDGRYPQIFPVEPALGGEAELRATIKHGQSLGYQMVAHDCYYDAYRISEDWSEEFLRKERDGTPRKGGAWGGGQGYNMCLARACELFAGRDLPRIRALGFKGLHYSDVISIIGPRPCHDPRHPQTCRQDAEAVNRILALAQQTFGGSQSEGSLDFAAPSLDRLLYVDCDKWLPLMKRPYVDAGVPLYETVYHGVLLYSLSTDTVNSQPGEAAYLRSIEYGAVPLEYFYGHFMLDASKNWLGKRDYRYDNAEGLRETVAGLKRVFDDVEKLRHLQMEFIEGHREIAKDVFETAYANGQRVAVNYRGEPFPHPAGGTVPAGGYLLLER